MITSLLHFGLGNRLYQIVYTIEISKKYNINYFFSDTYSENIEHQSNFHYKNNIFNKLSFNYEYLNDFSLTHNKYNYFLTRNKKDEILLSIDDMFNLLNNNVKIHSDKDYVIHYREDDARAYKIYPKYFDRYFYNDLFINKKILNEIRDKYQNFKNSICMLVRRGDFLTVPRFKNRIKDNSYFYNAIKQIEQYKKIDTIYVISDDIQWCKDQIIDHRIIYVDEVDYIQFYLATLCENFITTNSTFLFWSILLSLNNDIVVVSDKPSTEFDCDLSHHFDNISAFDNISKHIILNIIN